MMWPTGSKPARLLVFVALAVAVLAGAGVGAARRSSRTVAYPAAKAKLIGRYRMHTVQPGETLLDIARRYDLGITNLQAYYPSLNPWVLEEGIILRIPTLWILPAAKGEGIVVNVPELRLYYFMAKYGTVSTHPVTVGEKETPTPLGTYRVVEREVDPQWNIPPSLRHKYKEKSVPPGEDNPLGKYWLGLSRQRYGIHGTDNAWSVGRVISNGCIRLYPEDMEDLYPDVPRGTIVHIVYQPVKFGFADGNIFIEVHEDIYDKIGNMEWHARAVAKRMAILDSIDWEQVRTALHEKRGVPVPVGIPPKGGEGERSSLHR